MKIIYISFILAFLLISCSKPEKTDTTATTSGVVNFWTKNASKLPLSLKINGQEKFITQSYSAQPAGCQGNTGCAFFDLPPDNYNVIVKDVNGVTSNVTHSVTAGGCIQYQITF